ncbi:anhydro-N-acetylmuramic acid kinase [Parahalioglobus pacificus]|uniref:Anhydro-N-acetylmuramic acid kinase n=1 Tax=Parahalioglobus pacificus TaxID=930806 RepID=A0A919CKR9_9GAMM|nr:anhydro-N-acetylmuramic acid kinase [Halioglobus pacificus]GHD33377.1 anhydro-N-acetylmuramic acid kinase [Halioglobus pacificus]
MPERLMIGLMSGTSADGIDAALVSCGAGIALKASLDFPLPADIKQEIVDISHSGSAEIERMGSLDRRLGILFADAVDALLSKAGVAPAAIAAIGSHGQTLRHRPPSAGNEPAFTVQIGDPNTIAERTGITTVADFRRRDIAAGGEGAPLAPAFHAAAFAQAGKNRAIVNIGGFANVTLLSGETLMGGFDSGPGNTLLDQWVLQHQSQPFDRDGQWSAEGNCNDDLLAAMLSDDYFSSDGPRSTGKELFNRHWLETYLQATPSIRAQDVQSTLSELTATSIARSITGAEIPVDEIYVCGGGARNVDLMRRLYRHLSPRKLEDTSALGLDPEWVEAVAFAWLAEQTLQQLPGNAPIVTGAQGKRILGGIFPA